MNRRAFMMGAAAGGAGLLAAPAVRAMTSRSRSGSNFAPFSTSGITAVLKAEASSV